MVVVFRYWPFFVEFLQGVQANGGLQESKSRVIDLQDDDPEAIEHLLLYLYTLELPNMRKMQDEGVRFKCTTTWFLPGISMVLLNCEIVPRRTLCLSWGLSEVD